MRASLRRLTPAQSLLWGFTLITLVGTILLTLPVASARGVPTPFIDAFFTASSAVTTTGLITVDTGSYYSLFGQLVILLLFQIGGLGYMTFIVFLASFIRSRLSLGAGLTMAESVAGASPGELREFVRAVLLFTFAFEAVGAAALSLHWMGRLPPAQAVYAGIFHSVSAFCTAGFSLFADSFVPDRDSILANATVAVVTIAGGIGFFVLWDLYRYLRRVPNRGPRPRISIHSKLALVVSAVLMILGSAIVFFVEKDTAALPFGQRFLASTFQALSASTTTGFNSLDIGKMSETSLFVLIILMFVGASPGGTAGGIKTTTLGVVLLSAAALLRGDQDTVLFRKRLPLDTVYRALTIGMAATAVITLDALLLTATEKAAFFPILFEVVSALGTVGLSMGITANLTLVGKVVISLTMLAGRLGPLAVGFALAGRPRPARFRYLEDNVFVG